MQLLQLGSLAWRAWLSAADDARTMKDGLNALPVLFDDSHALKGALQVIHIATQLHQLHI